MSLPNTNASEGAFPRPRNSNGGQRTHSPVFAYDRRYQTVQSKSLRRDTATIIRDWLFSQNMTETLSSDRNVSVWSIDGEPVVELRWQGERAITLTMAGAIYDPVEAFMGLDQLPNQFVLNSGRDLSRIAPMIRLGLDKPVWRSTADCVLMYKRIDECRRTRELLGLSESVDGARPMYDWHIVSSDREEGRLHA